MTDKKIIKDDYDDGQSFPDNMPMPFISAAPHPHARMGEPTRQPGPGRTFSEAEMKAMQSFASANAVDGIPPPIMQAPPASQAAPAQQVAAPEAADPGPTRFHAHPGATHDAFRAHNPARDGAAHCPNHGARRLRRIPARLRADATGPQPARQVPAYARLECPPPDRWTLHAARLDRVHDGWQGPGVPDARGRRSLAEVTGRPDERLRDRELASKLPARHQVPAYDLEPPTWT